MASAVPLPPWDPCPACEGAGVTECGRFTSQKQAPEFPCERCGATGLARIRDAEGHGAITLPALGGPPTGNHRRVAEGILARISTDSVTQRPPTPAQQVNLLAQMLADYEAFLRSGLA